MSQVQTLWRLTDFTFFTLYADHGGKTTNRAHFPGYSLPKPARFGDVSNRLPSSPLTAFSHGYFAKMVYPFSNTHCVA
jgi:hypothetical protein